MFLQLQMHDTGRNSKTAIEIKSEKQKKSELLSKIDQLEIKATVLSKERATQLYHRKGQFREEFQVFEELDLKFEHDRKIERNQIKQQLHRLRLLVEKFQNNLMEIKPSPAFIEKLRESMEEIENAINNFKAKQRDSYEELLKEEKITANEILAIENKIDSWAKGPMLPTIGNGSTSKVVTSNEASVPEEISTFEKFLVRNGGHRGGWDEYDHSIFIRLRKKFKVHQEFLEEALSQIPGKSMEEIQHHEQWYSEYAKLLENKKIAIEKWKKAKDEEKIEITTKIDMETKSLAEKEKAKQTALAKKLQEEKQERSEKLRNWKVKKDLEKALEEERKAKENMEKMEEHRKERKKQLQAKEQVRKMRQQREAEKMEIRLLEEAMRSKEKESRKLTEDDIERIRDRDQKILEIRQHRLKTKELDEIEKIKRLNKIKSQVDVHATRDPKRLFKLTSALHHRLVDKEVHTTGGNQAIPHRAIPSWRSGIN
ncbi:uncharacterized protein TRIADDRAFT_54601 [Trichoplax adhaerens]|uniref:Coiled-coil domain-containing protein 112 n=1 Tax=Trichoplax adhaerens TaxID=10228 RepID=B3RSH7_TRIAD|nr:hypothetical protein TRIADDRAFT_54601 [Trichoplax adhaerens]EDV26513.1 hypothetical protein TRIADDRAFT_54601 [Trichoplax adhaerens]|eukprot:XP_002110509.1 hypothetical protein TRIADDRAFT_54601 [Trichoplax adhaerens]